MNERERFETLLSVLGELREANLTTPILVEGKRDVAALRTLGFTGEVVAVHNGRTLFSVAEDLSRETRAVVLLTDWDRKGGLLRDQLASSLAANGVQADTAFRDRVHAWVNMQLKDVESLVPYVTRGLRRFHRVTLEEHHAGLALG